MTITDQFEEITKNRTNINKYFGELLEDRTQNEGIRERLR